jgi:hypothetical protein
MRRASSRPRSGDLGVALAASNPCPSRRPRLLQPPLVLAASPTILGPRNPARNSPAKKDRNPDRSGADETADAREHQARVAAACLY